MTFKKTIFIWALLSCITTVVTAQSISIDDSKNAVDLVKIVTNNSSCININGESVNGDNFSPGQNSFGYFNNQGGSFPFNEGIVLSTWSSIYSSGPFIREPANGPRSGNSSWTGDGDLEQALGITNTSNATALEFNFTAITNTISFNYLFASNEYQDNFPCNYSDGFAFLIKEIGTTTYQNLAVLPGTNTAVSSKNVHPTINTFNSTTGPKPGCPAVNESYFGSLNTSPTNTSPINYSGQTIVMNAQTTVIPGKTYHVKLVIADQGGYYYDSAVFIEAGSFTSKIDLGSDRVAPNNPICFGEKFIIDTKLPSSYIYKWFKDGSITPIPGEINSTYQASVTGNYSVEVEIGSSNCKASGEIKLEYTPEIILNNSTLVQCDINGDGISIFDLTKMDTTIKNNVAGLSNVVYYESLIDAQNQNNPIQNSTSYKNTSLNQIVYARVSNSSGCSNYAELKLEISNNSIAPQNPISICDSDGVQDGFASFDLNLQVTPQVLNGLPSGLIVEYYLNTNDAITQKNPLPNTFKNTISNQSIYARIINGSECYEITTVTLVVNTFEPSNFQDENKSLCSGTTTQLNVNSNFPSYSWYFGTTPIPNQVPAHTITIDTPGNYSVKVTNANGCEATKSFNVIASTIATITGASINDLSGNENSVLVQYTGLGTYEFSLDGFYFQDNPLFNGVIAGTYWIYVRDKYGCGLSIPYQIHVLDYPRYFTPNGDGINDNWTIKNLNLFPNASVTIYDRYGKLLKQINANDSGWNGTYNGDNLPSNDYWFNLKFEEGKVIKGHFSLKR